MKASNEGWLCEAAVELQGLEVVPLTAKSVCKMNLVYIATVHASAGKWIAWIPHTSEY